VIAQNDATVGDDMRFSLKLHGTLVRRSPRLVGGLAHVCAGGLVSETPPPSASSLSSAGVTGRSGSIRILACRKC
jgi:hypothetical protein